MPVSDIKTADLTQLYQHLESPILSVERIAQRLNFITGAVPFIEDAISESLTANVRWLITDLLLDLLGVGCSEPRSAEKAKTFLAENLRNDSLQSLDALESLCQEFSGNQNLTGKISLDLLEELIKELQAKLPDDCQKQLALRKTDAEQLALQVKKKYPFSKEFEKMEIEREVERTFLISQESMGWRSLTQEERAAFSNIRQRIVQLSSETLDKQAQFQRLMQLRSEARKAAASTSPPSAELTKTKSTLKSSH